MTNVNVKEDMSDWIFPIKERFTLSDSFLEKYKDKQPNWGPLGYVIYKRSYSRLIPGEDRSEEWVDTCKRVVEGSYTVQLNHCKSLKLFWDQRKAQYSAQKMFDKMFNLKFCPAGRGLYCMGTDLIYKRGSAGLFNCSTISTKNIKTNFSNPFAFMMDFGMYGVGIGFDTKGANTVTIKEPSIGDYTFTVDDSRQGWVELLRVILDSYVGKTKYPKNIDYSKIRPEGSPIVTSGGIAPGPKCLIDCIESITKILNSRINEKLTSGNITDIMNIIGKCVISGGKRRIAQIAFGDYSDEEYISLKDPVKYEKELLEYRWASNNSVFAEIGMDYNKTIDKTITNGEPGYIYLDALKNYGRFKDGRQENIDADVDMTNPCGEIGLSGGSAGYGGELCNLSEVFPSNHENIDEFKETLKYAYLYCKSVTLIPTHNEETNALILKNRRIGISQSGVTNAIEKLGIHEYFEWCDQGYQYIKEMDVKYSNWLCIPKSIKLTTTKPSGCRTNDSLTTLNSGIFTLEELLKDHPENNEWNLIEDKNLYVLQDNKKNKITKTYRNGLSDIYKIKLRYNYELECTPNHKWFVKENHSNKHQNKNEIKKINDWIRTDELKPGYVLDVNMNSYNNDNSYKFKKIETPKTIFRKNDNNINQPDEMNCDIAWFLGYLWGDGCFSPTKFRIRFMDQYIFNLEKIQRIMKEQFNLDKKIHKSSGDRDASVYEVGSVMLWNWLKENDIWKYKYENYIENRCLSDIPKCVRYSKKEHILSFIAGLIDSDGCISVSNKNKLLAQITTSYDEFAKHLQQVCFSVGICIGRSHNTKGHNHQCNNNKKSIWLMSINQNTDKKSFYVLLKNSNKMTKYNNEYKELEWTCLGNSGHKYKLGKIISVEKLEDKKETFDIEVENEHWYYSGGIKSHNTVSLLPGVNPGIHYAHSEYYIRRVRIEEKNPLIKILKKSGYKIEPSVYGDNTMVVEFPIKSENFLKSKFDVSVWEQMQLMTMVQHYWSDNSVSSTITFKEEEKKDLKTILEMYEDKIKTVSFLPLDVKSYQQMPYETITKEQYEDMIKNIKPLDFKNIQNVHDYDAEEKFCNSETCELQVK